MPAAIPFEDRFWKYVSPIPFSGCWIWLGVLEKNGYAKITTGYKNAGTRKTRWAHRVSYEHFVGPIPEGMDLDHACRVRCCVNPEHLEPVTRAENSLRGVGPDLARLRPTWVTHCKRGHPFEGANLGVNRRGHRYCKTCHRLMDDKWRSKNAIRNTGS